MDLTKLNDQTEVNQTSVEYNVGENVAWAKVSSSWYKTTCTIHM